MPHSVLIADADTSALAATVRVVSEAGYLVTAVASFQEAKSRLALAAPDLLITDVRLGAYNGLHLVIRARAQYPNLDAIITHTVPDPVLQSQVAAEGALYSIKPIGLEALLSIMADVHARRALQEGTASRRSRSQSVGARRIGCTNPLFS
jgi:DNA-binding NtrC family response regulator